MKLIGKQLLINQNGFVKNQLTGYHFLQFYQYVLKTWTLKPHFIDFTPNFLHVLVSVATKWG